MGLSESDIAKAAVETGSIELCTKHLHQLTDELEKQFTALKMRLGPILRERNPEIEEDRASKLVPASIHGCVNGKCALAVELVTIIQKIRAVEIETETVLRNLDL